MNYFRVLKTAIKAFFKALKEPQKGAIFLEGENAAGASEVASHLRLLTLLQKEGRLIDFLKEDISRFTDTQIGAAVRKIHTDCGKTLEEFVTIRPLLNDPEGEKVTVPYGYDTHAIKVIGKVVGDPPYLGVLRHKGWKAHKLSLPKSLMQTDQGIISAAEVEVR
jgi:hypothetical protein